MAAFSEQDHALVTDAVARAERKSDGEIVTIIAERSDSYHDVALHYAVLMMLLVPSVIALLPQGTIDWASGLVFGWNPEIGRGAVMLALFVLMAATFLIVRFALAYIPLRMALTPKATKARRVGRRAVALFRASAERKTRGRTGVLLYLSLIEHRAEILADEAIASKVEPEVWGEAMEVLIDHVKDGRVGQGMAEAVDRIGDVLAGCLPNTVGNDNELPDRLIQV